MKRSQILKSTIAENKLLSIVVAFLYTIFYLIAVRDIELTTEPTSVQFVSLHRAVEATGFLQYSTIGKIVVEPIVIFISPLNILIASGIAVLVSLNFTLLYTVFRNPTSCSISDTTGLLASLPALLSGTACCGPIIPIILGIQITGTFITFTRVAVPISIVLLLFSIYYLLNRISG